MGFSTYSFVYGKKKYNLQSGKSEGIQVPVQLQLSSDNDFIMNLLSSNTLAMAQQELQNSSSDGELDCSATINRSDNDNASTSGHSFNRLEPETSSHPTQNSDSNGVQALVNQHI